jgi:hypothetical protein
MTTFEGTFDSDARSLEPATPRHPVRSVAAVLGGLVFTGVVTTAVDLAFHAAEVYPPVGERMSDALFVLALAYRLVLNAAGCTIAARLAPASPMRHALALGAVGTVLATIGSIAMWDCGPAWYSLANIAAAFPCAWIGGRLAAKARE